MWLKIWQLIKSVGDGRASFAYFLHPTAGVPPRREDELSVLEACTSAVGEGGEDDRVVRLES